ncbi:MAG: HD-GYP domain-containing protein [Gemmatimonadota bacterium]|nr:HD-GYP domain-containing protein [Gemmatimonadota bacterium]
MQNTQSRRTNFTPFSGRTPSEAGETRQHAYAAVLALLSECVERQDPYTRDHCEQVSQYARLAAERLALTDDEKHVAACAALLHDVGKVGVRNSVLNKPGPLLPEERAHVRTHVRIGYDMLREVPALEHVAEAVLYHHERFDGSGYPRGLAGEQIPVASRIVAVVDSYCAMLDRRCYKEAYSVSRARAELLRCSGTQFDPVIVRAVLAAIREIDGPATDVSTTHGVSAPPRLQTILIQEMPFDDASD